MSWHRSVLDELELGRRVARKLRESPDPFTPDGLDWPPPPDDPEWDKQEQAAIAAAESED